MVPASFFGFSTRLISYMIMQDPIAKRFTINPLVFLTGTVERTQDDERNPPALCPPSNLSSAKHLNTWEGCLMSVCRK